MASQTTRMTIGALSRQTGVHIETIRYYERDGVLPKPPRTDGGHRIYDESHVRRLRFIRHARELGFTLAEVRNLLRLVDGRAYSCAEVKALTLAHSRAIRRKIADLERLDQKLQELADQCPDEDTLYCPIVDTLFDEGGTLFRVAPDDQTS